MIFTALRSKLLRAWERARGFWAYRVVPAFRLLLLVRSNVDSHYSKIMEIFYFSVFKLIFWYFLRVWKCHQKLSDQTLTCTTCREIGWPNVDLHYFLKIREKKKIFYLKYFVYFWKKIGNGTGTRVRTRVVR